MRTSLLSTDLGLTLALTRNKGVGVFRWIDGVYAQRVIDDETPLSRLIDDETRARIYEAINRV